MKLEWLLSDEGKNFLNMISQTENLTYFKVEWLTILIEFLY